SYYASKGTTTVKSGTTSSGLFCLLRSYGIRDATDGVSNTIAFAEGALGTGQKLKAKGNGIVQDGTLPTTGSVLDASAAYPAVRTTLETCNKSYAAGTRAYLTDRGLRWGVGSEGYTIFNTVVTPNSVTYPWSVCKWGTSGAAQQSEYIRADSYHPGGVN